MEVTVKFIVEYEQVIEISDGVWSGSTKGDKYEQVSYRLDESDATATNQSIVSIVDAKTGRKIDI